MFRWSVHTAYQARDTPSWCSQDPWPCTEAASANLNTHLLTMSHELETALTENKWASLMGSSGPCSPFLASPHSLACAPVQDAMTLPHCAASMQHRHGRQVHFKFTRNTTSGLVLGSALPGMPAALQARSTREPPEAVKRSRGCPCCTDVIQTLSNIIRVCRQLHTMIAASCLSTSSTASCSLSSRLAICRDLTTSCACSLAV